MTNTIGRKSCRKHCLKHCLTCFMRSIDAFSKVFDRTSNREFDKVFDKKYSRLDARFDLVHTSLYYFHLSSKINYKFNMTSIEAALVDLALQKSSNYTATAKKFNINRSTLS